MRERARRALALALTVVGLFSFVPAAARAEPPVATEGARAEARVRFDRGLKLFNEGDNAGALAEFKRADELIPNTLVDYNIGLVYAAMGRPVEAMAALDRVLGAPGSLSPDRLARAKRTRDEQAERVASLEIVTSAPAAIEIDNVAIGHTPSEAPFRVASGVHIVGAIATGFAPAHKEVTVAAGETAQVSLELVAIEGSLAHLTLQTHLPAASVVLDDVIVGKTPLAQSITVAPGTRKIELRRPGYLPAHADVELGQGASAVVTLEPEEDPAAVAVDGGRLALDISEPQATVTIDGRSRGAYLGDIALPPGPHRLVVRRSGFEQSERDVTVNRGRMTTVRVDLEPSPTTRATYVGRTTSQRTWGLVAVGAGVVVAGASVALLVWNDSQKSDAKNDLDLAEANIQKKIGVCASNATTFNQAACNNAALDAQGRIDDANNRAIFGYVGIGVGAAAALFGGYLLLSNDDPHRYDKLGSLTSRRLRPVGWTGPHGGGGAGLAGAF